MGAVGGSLYLARLMFLIRGLVTARFLGPSDYGVWGALSILLNYSNLTPLGSAEAVGREVPFYAQRGEAERVRETKEQAFSFNIYASLLAVLAIVIFALARRTSLAPAYFYGLLVVAAGITFQQLYFFYGIVLRAEKRFFFKSKVEIVYAAVNVPITIALVVIYGLPGLFASFLINIGFIVFYLRSRIPIHFRFRLKRSYVVELIRIGFPVYLIGLVYTVFLSVDRIVIVKYLTSSDMGYYSIAVALVTVLGEAPIIIAQVMGPSLIERYSSSKSLSEVYPYVQIPTMAITFCFPVLLVTAIFGIEYLIRYLLPKFLPGFTAIEILVVGSFFMGMTRGASSFLLAIRRQTVAVIIYVICVGVAVVLNVGMVKAGYGLNGIALATSLTYLALFLMYTTYVFSFFFQRDAVSYLKFYGKVFSTFAYSLIVFLFLRHHIPLQGVDAIADAWRVAIKIGLYLLVMSPWVIYFLRSHGLWEELWRQVRRTGSTA
jgi:O-antigen/teichoic acid export membrane protein